MTISDHHPISLTLTLPETNDRTFIWKLDPSLLTDKSVEDDLRKCLSDYFSENNSPDTSNMTQWEAHKCVIRGKMIAISASLRKARKAGLAALFAKLRNLEASHKQTLAQHTLEELTDTRALINETLNLNVKKKFILSQKLFYEQGNKCGRFLAQALRKQRNNNVIHHLRSSSGELITHNRDIAKEFEKYYSSLYNLQNSAPDSDNMISSFLSQFAPDKISSEASESLDSPISPVEWNLALKSLKPGKSPGPDGLPALYYKTFSDLLRKPFLKAFNSLSPSSPFSQRMLEAHIVVIPKEGKDPSQPNSENCMKCPDDEWPNEKKDRCLPRVVEFLSYTDDPIVVVFSAVSILSFLLTGLILRIFIYYQDTPIVKANNRNLSYLLLVSIMLSFLCVFLFLGHPVDVTCMLRVTSFGVIFSVAVSSLLAKSIMVCIAFKATRPGSHWRKWMGAKLPNSIICVFSLVQVKICVTWLSISPPFQDRDTHSYQGKVIIQCNEGSVIGFYSVLGYMGLLAAVSFIIAFLARTLPDSFNETKYITFSMLVFCSVWIAMIPAYLSTRGKYMVGVEVFAIMASSSGLLGCIFFPKCYVILFRPDLNTKTVIR
ncbi:uncharacterized protein LOC143986462 [Lithobates pipiens]